MRRLILLLDDGDAPSGDGQIVRWAKRDVAVGEISLDARLDEKLLAIRGEHMDWAYATGFSRAGADSLQSALKAGASLSMWWASLLYERHPKLSPWLYPLYKLRALESLLTELKPDVLVVRGNDPKLKKYLAQLCDAYGISLEYIKRGAPKKSPASLKEKLYFFFPAPVRAAARFLLWLWQVKRLLPFPSEKNKSWRETDDGLKNAAIASYFPNLDLRAAAQGSFRSRYWESLHEALNAEAKKERPNGPHFVRWLLIRFPSPELSFKQCLALRDRFRAEGRDGLTYNYLEEFLTVGDVLAALRRYAALALQSLVRRPAFARACRLPGSRLDFWPLARGQWAESFAGWRCLERCLQDRAFARYAGFAGSQRWFLFPLENCPWERMLTVAAREAESPSPVYGVQHSIVRRTDFRYFDAPATFSNPVCAAFQPDIVGGNGENALSQWRANGLPENRLKRLEALRYLYLADAERGKPGALPPEPGEPLEDPATPRLLVLTSFFRDETDALLDLLGKALDAGLLKGWRAEIKPHPYLPVDDWVAARPAEQQAAIRVLGAPLSEILRPGVKVWAANSTTASLEAVLKGQPVMVMAPVNDFDLCPIQNLPGLPRSGTLADARKWLEDPKPVAAPPNYLDLNPDLRAWRELLNLERDSGEAAKRRNH